MSLIPSSNQNKSEDVALLERTKHYRQIAKKCQGDIFEATLRAWKHYFNFWHNGAGISQLIMSHGGSYSGMNMMNGVNGFGSGGQDGGKFCDNRASPISREMIDFNEVDLSKYQIYTPSLKLATQLVFTLSEEITWDMYIYPRVRKLRNLRTTQAQEKLYILLNTMRSYYNEILVYMKLVKSMVLENHPEIWKTELSETYKKLMIKVYYHLGDAERYCEDHTNLLVASQFYKKAFEVSEARSGFALNQIATVECLIYESRNEIDCGFRAFGFYILASLAKDPYPGAITNMRRLEQKIGKKPRPCEEIFLKSFLAVYVTFVMPVGCLEHVLAIVNRFDIERDGALLKLDGNSDENLDGSFDESLKENLDGNLMKENKLIKKEPKQKLTGFKKGGNLALGFLKKNLDKNSGSDGAMSSSSCEDTNESVAQTTPQTSPEKIKEQTASEENLVKLSNAMVGFMVIARILKPDKITTDIQGIASRLLDKFERCKAAGLTLNTMAKLDTPARQPFAKALLTVKGERDENGLDVLIKTCKVWISKKITEPGIPISKPYNLTSAPASIQPRITIPKATSVIKLPPTMKNTEQFSGNNNTTAINAKPDLPNPPEFVMLDTSLLLNSLNFVRDQLVRSSKLQGAVIIPSLTIDGLDVVKSVEQASRMATNWLLIVKKESFLKMVPCEGEYLKYNARSSHDQVSRDKSRIKQLSKFAKTYFKSNTTSGRVMAAAKNTKLKNKNSKNINSNNNIGIPKNLEDLIDDSKQSIILVSDRVEESAYKGTDNVYSLSRFKECFALT